MSDTKNYYISQVGIANFTANSEEQLDDLVPNNSYLTNKLLHSIEPYNGSISKFILSAKRRSDTDEYMTNQVAKNYLINSFPGVLGIRLRKLIAEKEDKQNINEYRKNYIENCHLLAKETLQIICFILISTLWDCKCNYHFTDEQKEAIQFFFEDVNEMGILEYFNLLNFLLCAFSSNNLSFPIPEFSNLKSPKEENELLHNSCAFLKTINKPDIKNFTHQNCLEAEQHLTELLKRFSFLCGYKMASVKGIEFEKLRNKEHKFLLNYASLGVNKFTDNEELISFENKATTTDTVILYRIENESVSFLNCVQLFPFIIDANSLAFERNVKICFYTSRDTDGTGLKFQFLENNSIDTIESIVLNTKRKLENFNESTIEKIKNERIQKKITDIHLLFDEAKKCILFQ